MTELILASSSPTRRRMLEAAGLDVRIVPAAVDEDAHRAALARTEPAAGPIRVAQVLARAKAEEVSRRHPDALVIGADQVLAFDGEVITKSADIAAAHGLLSRLAGRTHQLHSAVALATGGSIAWDHVDTASLTMRAVSSDFLDSYIARVGPGILGAVGCYELEGVGVQLMNRIEGDYFTVLGLPLVALLAELRRRHVLQT